MKKYLLRSLFAGSLACAFTLIQGALFAQGPATPGPEHQALKKLEGTWTAKVKMGDAESTGTMTYKMELGGLWLLSHFQGEFGDQKFEGRGMDTYDPMKKKYLSVWVDSMSTQPMLSEGTYDEKEKILTMTGKAPGPDGEPAQYRMVVKETDDDHHTFTMYMIGKDGQENKMMTIDYTRKQ
jgi:hypothetical protein